MSDFGISKVLTNLDHSDKNKVVDFIKYNLGAEDYEDVLLIKEEDLTKNDLLNPIQARKLIKYWTQDFAGNAGGSSGSGVIRQHIVGNAGRVVAAGRDYKVTHNKAGTMNTFESAQEVQTGGTRANNVYNLRDVKGHGAFAGSNKTTNHGTLNQNIS